ncbi:MAG: hypothetical protein ACI86H_002643 [bacterium]|jgi:uncharacterized protein (TIGR00730 family)
MIKNLCVFCGSNSGKNPAFTNAAKALGKILVENDIGLVYGGGNIGLMGVIAETVFELGGNVIGVIPRFLEELEVAFSQAHELHIVEGMHERKAMMADLADGFIAMPGGFGTFEEIFEVVTWTQLNIHQKPCGLLNIDGYYNHLLSFLDHATDQDFLKPKYRELLIEDSTPISLLQKMNILS